MNSKIIHATTAVLLSLITIEINELIIPFITLIIVMLLDYISGIAKAWQKSALNSGIGIKGIIKKVFNIFLVIIGIILDILMLYIFPEMQIKMLFSLMITFYIIINEIISILENINELGIKIPKFVEKLISKLKNKIDDDNMKG